MKCGKQESWHEAATDLRNKLSRYASKPRFNEEFEDAFSFFFGEGPEEMQDELEPAAYSRFMEWFIHDYRLSNGHRLIELFEMEYIAELPPRLRHLLGEWQKSCLTLAEIIELGSDMAKVRDLLLGGEYVVTFPPPASTQGTLAPGRLLVGRLMRVGEVWELPGGATILSERLRDRLLQLVRGEFRRFHRNRGGAWQEFLHEQGFVFNDLIDNLGDEIDLDDTPVYMRAIYDITDMQACVRGMRGAVEPAQVGRRYGEISLAPQTQAWPGLIGELRLADGRLEVVCATLDEFISAKQAVTAKLGLAVKHRIDVYERRPGALEPRRSLLRGVSSGVQSNEAPYLGLGGNASLRPAMVEAAVTSEEELPNRLSGKVGSNRTKAGQQELSLGEPLPAAAQQPDLSTDEQRDVAQKFCKVLVQTGASQEHIDSAMWIWADFCHAERPRVRHAATWAAAVHVTLGRVEGWRLRNSALARVYGAKPASVSRNAALIAAALDVRQFDDRYCVEHPVDGLLKRLGAVEDGDAPRQAEEILGASVSAAPAEQTAILARLVELRGVLAGYAIKLDGLERRAHEQFFGHVGCSHDDAFWQDCFTDWFHFDWAIPVRGGLTVLEEALDSQSLADEDARQLAQWRNCHPAYYVVDSVRMNTGNESALTPIDLVLRPLRGEGSLEVAWPLSAGSLKRGDVILARLVPLDGVTTSVGHALHFNASLAGAIRLRLDEERALLDHWNGRRLKWEEISARYAERLYAIAYRAARGFPDED